MSISYMGTVRLTIKLNTSVFKGRKVRTLCWQPTRMIPMLLFRFINLNSNRYILYFHREKFTETSCILCWTTKFLKNGLLQCNPKGIIFFFKSWPGWGGRHNKMVYLLPLKLYPSAFNSLGAAVLDHVTAACLCFKGAKALSE